MRTLCSAVRLLGGSFIPSGDQSAPCIPILALWPLGFWPPHVDSFVSHSSARPCFISFNNVCAFVVKGLESKGESVVDLVVGLADSSVKSINSYFRFSTLLDGVLAASAVVVPLVATKKLPKFNFKKLSAMMLNRAIESRSEKQRE